MVQHIHLSMFPLRICVPSYVMRMKEYERERRLQLRKKRIEAQAEAAWSVHPPILLCIYVLQFTINNVDQALKASVLIVSKHSDPQDDDMEQFNF